MTEKKHLVLADDTQSVLDTFSSLFSSRGYEVHPCEDAQRALLEIKSLKGQNITPILLTDLDMPPGMSGLHLLEALSAEGIIMPTILMSGNPNLNKLVEAATIKPDEVFRKGARPLKELFAALENAWNKHHSNQSLSGGGDGYVPPNRPSYSR